MIQSDLNFEIKGFDFKIHHLDHRVCKLGRGDVAAVARNVALVGQRVETRAWGAAYASYIQPVLSQES